MGGEAGDPGQGPEELHEDLGVELADHRSDRIGHRLLVAERVLELVGVVEALPSKARLGERIDQRAQRRFGKEVVDDRVGEGAGGHEARMQVLGQLLELLPGWHVLDHGSNVFGAATSGEAVGGGVGPSPRSAQVRALVTGAAQSRRRIRNEPHSPSSTNSPESMAARQMSNGGRPPSAGSGKTSWMASHPSSATRGAHPR